MIGNMVKTTHDIALSKGREHPRREAEQVAKVRTANAMDSLAAPMSRPFR